MLATQLKDNIAHHVANRPHQLALVGLNASLNYQELATAIEQLGEQLLKWESKHDAPFRLALALDNSPAWVVVDIACLNSNIVCIPLPHFFSDSQLQHAMQDGGANILITDQIARFLPLLPSHTTTAIIEIAGQSLHLLTWHTEHQATSTTKITYTSGTTGQPKGVCLDQLAMYQVAVSIAELVKIKPEHQHLCVLPLATLLENVAGVYACLVAGATVHLYPAEMIGFKGNHTAIELLHQAIINSQAQTLILIPELLKGLVQCYAQGVAVPAQLRFIAVGGAHVPPDLLKQAQALGLPVYQGYGLSESASVVTLNTPKANRLGSVGKPLPHIKMRLAQDGEIWIKGSNYLGYTTQALQTDADGYIATGDIGHCDESGFWYISGRKKNIFITSFGRNVSPEWVESELTHLPSIAQACLFGEAKPFNTALILPKADVSKAQIELDIALLNSRLPDYAQVGAWIPISSPFTPNNGQMTPNGRLKRDAIWEHYQSDIELRYKTKETT